MIALGTEIILGEPAIDKLELFEVASIIASYPVKFVASWHLWRGVAQQNERRISVFIDA
jgi:hypothetical protein